MGDEGQCSLHTPRHSDCTSLAPKQPSPHPGPLGTAICPDPSSTQQGLLPRMPLGKLRPREVECDSGPYCCARTPGSWRTRLKAPGGPGPPGGQAASRTQLWARGAGHRTGLGGGLPEVGHLPGPSAEVSEMRAKCQAPLGDLRWGSGQEKEPSLLYVRATPVLCFQTQTWNWWGLQRGWPSPQDHPLGTRPPSSSCPQERKVVHCSVP